MEHTDEQRAAFKAVYARRRRNQLAISLPLVVVLIGLVVSEHRAADTLLGLPAAAAGPVFLAIVAAAFVFSFRNWRCPACDKYLGRAFNPKHCHACGVELHD